MTDRPNVLDDFKACATPGQIAAVSVCEETLATLSKLEANLVDEVQTGLIEISEQIAAEQTMPNTPERIMLDLVAESTKGLNQAIQAAFELHRSLIRYQRNRFVLGKIKSLEVSEVKKQGESTRLS